MDEYAAQSEAQIQSWFASSWLTTVTRSFVTRMKKSNMYEKYCFFQKMFYTSCSIRIEKYYPEFRNFSSKLKSNKLMLTQNFGMVFKTKLKVRQSRNDFFKPTFPPKNEKTNSTLLLWNLRSTCFHLFFGRHQKDISKWTDLWSKKSYWILELSKKKATNERR